MHTVAEARDLEPFVPEETVYAKEHLPGRRYQVIVDRPRSRDA